MSIDDAAALWIEGAGAVYNAREYRRLLNALTQGADDAGVTGPGDFKVTQNSPTAMSVLVATGGIIIPSTTGTRQGGYFAYNSGTVTVSLAASDPTNPRIDLIICRVRDAEHDGGATNNTTIEAVTGTPAASPAIPATPNNALVLARVAVAASASTITNANITDTRTASRLWTQPRGEIGYGLISGNVGPASTSTDVTGCAVTFTAVEGRSYRAHGHVLISITGGGDIYAVARVLTGSTVLLADVAQFIQLSAVATVSVMGRLRPSAGSTTWKLNLNRQSGAGSFTTSLSTADRPDALEVEDIGGYLV